QAPSPGNVNEPDLQMTIRGHLVGEKTSRVLSTSCLTFTPEGQSLVTAAEDGRVRIWDLTTTQPRQGIPLLQQRIPQPLLSNAQALFLPDGKTLAETCTQESMVCLWDLSGAVPAKRATFHGHAHPIRWLTVLGNGQLLASMDTSNTLRLWDLTGNPPRQWG